jgi:SHS family lactate transporter-like MFS transporter
VKLFASLRTLTAPQWRAFLAAYLGWTLDAFDYFLLVMVVRHVAADFHAGIKDVAESLFLTLMMRPVGALLFGAAADRWGRRPALMASVLFYASMELFSAFAPSLGWLLAARALFGIGMGGEWGVGASLAMESTPAASRGVLSGILQEGYPVGYLLAALAYKTVFPFFGWRGMFIAGALPALLVILVLAGVQESPAWLAQKSRSLAARSGPGSPGFWSALKPAWALAFYMIALMTAFNFFSHGTQDLYPSAFLEKQRGLSIDTTANIAIIYSIGGIVGGVFFGALSQWIGRRRAIVAAALLTLPAIPLWVGAIGVPSAATLATGAFLVQFAVQGAWGVVPAHLNELSPASVRGILPGLTYQLGNLLASSNALLQPAIAARHGGDYGFSLGIVVAVFAVVLAGLAWFGPEAKDSPMGG